MMRKIGVVLVASLIAALGFAALLSARFDVFPDFAPPHVLVQTEAPGLDATQVEALVTRPLEGLLAGAENVFVGDWDSSTLRVFPFRQRVDKPNQFPAILMPL